MANDTVIRPSKKLSLLSCPFCGSNRVQVVRSFIDSDSNIVHCPHCDACGPRALSTEPEGTAEARWNASRATHETPTPTSNSKALLEEIARWIRTVRDDVFEHGNICGRTQRSGEDLLRRIDTVVMDSGSHETSDVLDAAKWRALRNCARITAIGSAGMGPERAADDYAHITLNFWTGVPDGDPGPAYAREWLDTFVDKALRGSLKANEERS